MSACEILADLSERWIISEKILSELFNGWGRPQGSPSEPICLQRIVISSLVTSEDTGFSLSDLIQEFLQHLARVRPSAALQAVQCRLLVSGFQPSVATVRGHRRFRIGRADLLVLPLWRPFSS